MDWTQVTTLAIAFISLIFSGIAIMQKIRNSRIERTKALEDHLIHRKLDIYQILMPLCVEYLNHAQDCLYKLDQLVNYKTKLTSNNEHAKNLIEETEEQFYKSSEKLDDTEEKIDDFVYANISILPEGFLKIFDSIYVDKLILLTSTVSIELDKERIQTNINDANETYYRLNQFIRNDVGIDKLSKNFESRLKRKKQGIENKVQ